MKDNIQAKIDHYRELAKKQAKPTVSNSSATFENTDSLSNAIRNKKEAAIFWAELNAAINIALAK